MTRVKIYSPPIITAKGKVKLGHGANPVWCDILARTLSDKGFSTDYYFPSWNHQGKMFDHLASTNDQEKELERIESTLAQKLSLFGLGEHRAYRDTSAESRKNAQDKFGILLSKGFIDSERGEYFLRIDKIRKQTGLVSHIDGANFFPEGGKGRIMDLVKTLDGAYPITKLREFATPIPGDGNSAHRISPIFDLAVSPCMFSEGPVDYSIDGLKTMLHGTFVPFVIYSGLWDAPFSRNVALHGYLLTGSNSDVEDLSEFHRKTNSDVLRGSALLCTSSMEDSSADETRIKKVIKGSSKLIRLAWFFKNFEFPSSKFNRPSSPSIEEGIKKMRQALKMDEVIERTQDLSGRLGEKALTERDYGEYASLLNDSRAFFPLTYDRAVEILMKKNSTHVSPHPIVSPLA